MKWVNLVAFSASAFLAAMYFYEDQMFLAVMWTIVSVIDGLLFVVNDIGL